MSTPEHARILAASTLDNSDAGFMTPDVVFTLIISSCLIVDVALVRLLSAACDQFSLPLLPFVIVGLFGMFMLATRIGSTLRASTEHLRD